MSDRNFQINACHFLKQNEGKVKTNLKTSPTRLSWIGLKVEFFPPGLLIDHFKVIPPLSRQKGGIISQHLC